MFLLLLLLISFSFYFVFLTWCLRLHARVLRRPFCVDSGNSMCFSYWKNVRLKPFCLPHSLWHRRFQLLLKECTIEAWRLCVKNQPRFVSVVIERMYDWSPTEAAQMTPKEVSVVIERMYDWSSKLAQLEAEVNSVSVVIERMYDWSGTLLDIHGNSNTFQLLLKECTIEAKLTQTFIENVERFSCYWKNVRLKLRNQLIENKRFLTVGFWSVFRKWSICTKSAIIFENLGWLLDCFW